jgi:hypothetical protein
VHRSARLSVLITFVLALGAPRGARADEAAELFARGRELVRAGKHAEACPLFEQSFRLAPGIGTELNLALCLGSIGRLLEAQTMLEGLVRKTSDADPSDPQAKGRETLARDALQEITGKIPTVEVDTSALPADTEVRLDGKVVDASVPIPLDPGRYRIEANGARPVVIVAEEGKAVTGKLEPFVYAPRPREVIILAGAGGGAILIGSITGLVVWSRAGDIEKHCTDTGGGVRDCDRRGIELIDSTKLLQHFTTALWLAGLGAGAAAAYLELRWRRSREAPVPTTWIAPSPGGLTIGGTW